MIEITRTKSWMKRTGAWNSDIWNRLANIQELISGTTIDDILAAIQELSSQSSLPTEPKIYNILIEEASREYKKRLPDGVQKFLVVSRTGVEFRLAFEPDRVAGANPPFLTVGANSSYHEDHVNLTKKTIYFASSTAHVMIEIVCWV